MKRSLLLELRVKLKKILNHKLTLMIVPHSAIRPFNFHFSFSFIMFLGFLWTALTSWATWAVFSNIDYWSMKADHEILKLKVHYFVKEVEKSRELVDEVRQADVQLRQLLGMKNRKAIFDAEKSGDGKGGPEGFDRAVLQKELNKELWKITQAEIRGQTEALQRETLESLKSYNEISEYIANERGLYRSTPQGWPALGRTTSHFGIRTSPITGMIQFHAGTDIANQKGTPIHVTADGVVQLSGWEGGYGNLVIVDHGFGFATYYGHNSKILAKVGDKVRRGQTIAYMGSTGSSTGDHCHYEVWHNGQPVNAWKYLVATSVEDLREAVLESKKHSSHLNLSNSDKE